MKKIAIVGAGDFGREVKLLIDQINAVKPVYELIGLFFDRQYDVKINGIDYLGMAADISKVDEELGLAV